MSEINCVEELVELFDQALPEERVGILKRVNIPIETLERYATWKQGGYTRNCIGRRKGFEFILICWDENAITPIHGHDGEDCWVQQISGVVHERRYKESKYGFELTNTTILKGGKLTYMHDRMGYHTLENVSADRAMTLHIYANPIERCKVYNEAKQTFEVVNLEYDSIREAETLSV